MRRSSLTARRTVAVLALGLIVALPLSGCGFDAQTLQADSPGQGVNVDAGAVKIRDVVLVYDGGSARVTGAIVSPTEDQLVSVSGHPVMGDGSEGKRFTVTGGPVTVPAGGLVDLTFGNEGFMVSSPDLRPGYEAVVSFTFRSGASAQITTIVMDRTDPDFENVTPVPPAPTPSDPAPPEPTQSP